ncbi:ABC-2 family transporter protein [Nonomuraea coxensis DSM 45129]|uniref:ABC-2 family transporter protein n=1 Tax=Nonomuraea coxensis DSM 45129 TaxID=1122611 RepID=A0ABX8U2G6_9ACTN|nr:ABC transporter permease [Nonomuraea coxensis]QYC41651.1 ABC-2 family transporter protein [Nonomuraea coxensis DSM 45129]
MIWVTWRQHRAQILVTAGFLALLGALLLVSAVEAHRYVAGHAPPGCPGPAVACGELSVALGQRYDAVYSVFGWMPLVAPALIGAFWGAPLLGREYERGTHRLAWTQAVPVRRWLTVKLAVLGAAVVAGGLLLSLMVSLWRPVFREGIDSTFGNIGVFNMVGVQPAAWWLYAFALGTAAGALFRRTLPAMALVVAGVTVTMFTLFQVSDHYAEPARAELSGTVLLDDPDTRLVSAAWVEPSGREVAEPSGSGCPRRADVGQSSRHTEAWQACLFDRGYRYAVYYHPPSRFWRFQWTEAGILALASAALCGVAVRRTVRRPG